ncbi:MAG: VWA domain-containing protein [Ignavibacteriae bacterium]|nr:VWA domain-containing protein [Ignavibacteriota bacterium]
MRSAKMLFTLALLLMFGHGLSAQSRGDYWRASKDGVGLSLSLYELDTTAYPDITMRVKLFNGTRAIRDTAFTRVDVTENDIPQNASIVCSLQPFSVALVLDRSLSMAFYPNTDVVDPDSGRWNGAKSALHIFIDQLLSIDQCALVSFCGIVRTEQGLTNDKKLLHDKLEGIKLDKSTAIWLGVDTAINRLRNLSGKRAIILLTDGEDNASRNTTMTVVANKAAGLGIPVYTVGLGEEVSQDLLGELATRTGGKFFLSSTGADLANVYQEISSELVDGCVLTYRSTNVCPDGTRRAVRVTGHYNGEQALADTAYTAPYRVPQVRFSFSNTMVANSNGSLVVPIITTDSVSSNEVLSIAGSFSYPADVLQFDSVLTENYALQGIPVRATAANGVLAFSADAPQGPTVRTSELFALVFRVPSTQSSILSRLRWNTMSFKRLCALQSITEDASFAIEGDCEKLLVRNPDRLLGKSYPNPLETTGFVPVYIPETAAAGADVSLRVLDPLGNIVATLHHGLLSTGDHTFTWDAASLPSGRYAIELIIGDKREQHQVLVIR